MGNGYSKYGFSNVESWPVLYSQDCQLSTVWLVYPYFLMTWFTSLKNGMSLWSWLGTDLMTAFVGIVLVTAVSGSMERLSSGGVGLWVPTLTQKNILVILAQILCWSFCFDSLFVYGPHLVVLTHYSWLCAQKTRLAGLGDHMFLLIILKTGSLAPTPHLISLRTIVVLFPSSGSGWVSQLCIKTLKHQGPER